MEKKTEYNVGLIDGGLLEQFRKQTDPLVYDEVESAVKLPPDKLTKVIDSKLNTLFDNAGERGSTNKRNRELKTQRIKEFRDYYLDRAEIATLKLSGNTAHGEHYENCVFVFELIITRAEHFLQNLPKLKPTFSEMKPVAIKYYEQHKGDFEKKEYSGRDIERSVLNYLKEIFPNAEKYPGDGTIRDSWLRITGKRRQWGK